MKIKKREMLSGYGFVLISLGGVLLFSVIPFAISIVYSFSRSSGAFHFVGIDNYVSLFQSGSFQLAIWNTIKFIAFGVPILMLVSLILALAFYHLGRCRYRSLGGWFAVSLLPMLVPSSVVVLFVRVMFEQYGVVNGWIASLGGEPITWMNSEWAVAMLLGLYVWKNFSYNTVILLGAMQSVSESTKEAAALDGASGPRILWSIVFPQIRSFFAFTFLLSTMGIFKMFRESYLLFGDYPHESVYMLQNFMNNNFYANNYQRLSTASILFFLLVSIAIFFIVRRRTESL